MIIGFITDNRLANVRFTTLVQHRKYTNQFVIKVQEWSQYTIWQPYILDKKPCSPLRKLSGHYTGNTTETNKNQKTIHRHRKTDAKLHRVRLEKK